MKRRTYVTVHDVCPAFERELDTALALCDAVGVRPGLLVVPDFHATGSLASAPSFVRRLRRLADDGAEIFLHGYFHRAAEAGGLGGFLRQRLISNAEAEFGELARDEAVRRIDAGLELFTRLGLPVHGFVPPAWVLPAALVPALGERGISYTETHLRILDPVQRRSAPSLVLNLATRSRARLFGSVAWSRAARPLAALVPARIAIHPGDLRSNVARDELERMLQWGRDSYVERARELFSA